MKRKVLACLLGLSMVATALSGCGAKKEPEMEKVTEVVTEKQTEAETEKVTEAVTEAETETEVITETETETEAVTEAKTETEAVTEIETEAKTEAVTEAEEVETESVTEEVTEAVTEQAVEAQAETKELTGAETEVETETETEAAEVETETETQTEAVAEAETEAAEVETETEAVTEAETEAEEAETVAAAETETAEVETEAVEVDTEGAADVEYEISVSADAVTGTLEDMAVAENDIVILYESDVHGGISADENYSGSSDSLGYAGLAAIKADVEAVTDQTAMIDLGDAIQGSVVTTESDGQDAMKLMEGIGYDICIPGNHEFDYGMDVFLEYAENASADFLSCNFVNTEEGAVFEGYKVVSYEVNGGEFQIGYVGICTPETISKSTPTYFQDEEGNFIYGFSAETDEQLYETVQASVDAALAEGADCIVALSHLGDAGVEEAWSSRAVVANTTGIDIILDGHAHSTIPGEIIADKAGEEVLLGAAGTKLENVGILKLTVAEDGAVAASNGLVNELTEEQIASEAYTAMDAMVQEIQEQYAYLFVKVGSIDYDLVIYDPADPETRLVRTTETNMGDFLTDAYRIQSGADIAFLNGGSIRANIEAGDITYMDLITVMPWNSETGVIEVTGQQILDCLEMGAHLYPEECGGFIQTSGLTYVIDTTMESSVNVNSDGEFLSVDGEYRVKDVMVGEEPLDLEKTYTLAINRYYSEECGDGMTMFKGSKIISPAEGEDWIIDHDVVIDYLAALGDKVGDEYADPYGQGRITLITAEPAAAAVAQPEEAETEEATEVETEAVTETAAEVETEAITEATTEVETEAVTDASAEIKTEAATEVETEAVTVVTTEAETETEVESETEAK